MSTKRQNDWLAQLVCTRRSYQHQTFYFLGPKLMDNSGKSSPEGSEDTSPLVEELPSDLANGDWPADADHFALQLDEKVNDSYRPPDNAMTLCESENSLIDAETMDEAPEPTITSSENERYVEHFAPIYPTESKFSNYLSESQEVSKDDIQPSIVGDQSSKDLMRPQNDDGSALIPASERVHDTDRSTEGPHQLAKAQHSDASSAFLDHEPPESGSINTISESRKSQESDLNIAEQEDDTILLKDNAYGKDVPVITIHETDPQKNQELGNGITAECNHTQPCEIENKEDVEGVQVGLERELNLEESIDPMEATLHYEDEKVTDELPSVIVEERPLAMISTHKVYAQTHETVDSMPPASVETYEGVTFDSAQAKAIHHVNELQTAAVHSVSVEFSTFQPGNNEFTTSKWNPEPIKESELAIDQSTEMTEPISRMELKKGEFVKVPVTATAVSYKPETKHNNSETLVDPTDKLQADKLPSLPNTKTLGGFSDDKENKIPLCAETNSHDVSLTSTRDYANDETELNASDEKLDFDTRYALLVGKILPGHEIYYMPSSNSKKKQVTFRRGGTLDQRQIVSGSLPLWDASFNIMSFKSATLEAPHRTRRRLQPKPAVNDDHLFPDSVTPSKVEKALSEDDTSASKEEGNRYDVPFMDDDAFVPKKYRSIVVVEDDSSSESDYSDERRNLLGTEHLAKMDETSSHLGLATIDGKRNIGHEGGSRWMLGLSICGCLRRRR
ncbi:hypothetical protein TcWFU_003869 [Taenia crassiceps]|uniref:Uncharacterized protein n=1 Tax=Taenia crassiceps TaxID=6207 RepID=A0ABR4QQL6_9CEST